MPRQHERTSFIAEISLGSVAGRHNGRVSDISEGGCYIDSIISVRVGDKVNFELVHPDGGRLAFSGEVAYAVEGMGFGIKFIDLDDEQKLFLQKVTTQ